MEKKKSYKWIAVDMIFMYMITGLGLILMAWMLEKFQLKSGFIEAGVIVIYVVSCWLGGFIAGKKMKMRKFLWGALLGIAYFLILFAVSAVINQGIPEDMVHMAVTLLICMAAGTLGGMMG